jgi:hypothetical protein
LEAVDRELGFVFRISFVTVSDFLEECGEFLNGFFGEPCFHKRFYKFPCGQRGFALDTPLIPYNSVHVSITSEDCVTKAPTTSDVLGGRLCPGGQ